MDNKVVEKICPTPSELSSVCSNVKCLLENCQAVFQSTSNLNMHLLKHHKIPNNGLTSKKVETQYFCPVIACSYYVDSKKFFTKLKYLKQHFLKVHALKEFVCKKCGKKYSTESFRNLHMKNCGKVFQCTCGSSYSSSEALLTHCKRKGKGHVCVQKEVTIDSGVQSQMQSSTKKTERIIYPKLPSDMSFPIHYIAAIALSELSTPPNNSKVTHKSIQTEMSDVSQKKQSTSNIIAVKIEKKRKNSQQTQTSGRYKKLKISAETQTNSEYLKQKGKSHLKTFLRKKKKSMETQTKEDDNSEKNKPLKSANQNLKLFDNVNSKNISADEEKDKKWMWDSQFFNQKEAMPSSTAKTTESRNSFFGMGSEINLCTKELDLNEFRSESKNSRETEQDNQIFDFNKLCNIETQTEIDAFLTECNEDTTFTLCSTTETQTTDDFDSLLYSNMCTQTSEEVDELFNFNFVHIETQTAWPDLNEVLT